MAQLQAHIDWNAKTITFSGPGTFNAKEQIKALGTARWRGDLKSWVVNVPDISVPQLKAAFPQLEIVESGETEQNEVIQAVPSGVPSGVGVAQFIAQVRAAIASAFPQPVFVRGVISKVKSPRHTYIELSDSEDSSVHINCFIWSDDLSRITAEVSKAGFSLEPDLDVMFEVEVGLNPRRGDISLTIRRVVVEYTIGKLAAERDKTNEKLKKEGLFEKNRQLSLPFLPTRLGLITSSAGTVINDFRSSLDQSKFGFQLFWLPAAVQGAAAKKELIQAIRTLGARSDLDAVLIFRGGGSRAELAVFNDYDVAKAVCLCPLPVLSAIGHQEDLSSVQDVSFKACGVPKDLGRFFADIVSELRRRFTDSIEIITAQSESLLREESRSLAHNAAFILSQAQNLLQQRMLRLQSLAHSVPIVATSVAQDSRHLLERTGRRILDRGEGAIERAMLRIQRFSTLPRLAESVYQRADERVNGLSALIEAVSPESQLRRGFSIVRKVDGSGFIVSASQANTGEQVEIEFYDARKRARIE
ncbi:MAG: exodeoxyribonuclease VII large subunit [Bdellovibrionales bacterium]|nr:exodeoxyribonuclease VII large subunit [Bdellovibrionales bacterium]